MKCPYNNFEECLEYECPAFYRYTNICSTYNRCRYALGDAAPPNNTTIINNYYNNEKGE